MKTKLAALLFACTTALSFGHGGVEIGPNKGRLLELSKDETTHGEVTVKDGKFHIAILDKDLKPVAVAAQSLTATGGPQSKQAKLEVTKSAEGFTLPVVKDGEWLILQFKETAKGKAVTARLHYDTGNCDGCNKPEWLCECKDEEEKKEEKKDAKTAEPKQK
jgi:hypothetical protein